MEYQEFVEMFRRSLSETAEIDSERIQFEEEGGRFRKGDRLLIEFADHEDSTEICALHTEELYDLYQKGKTLQELVQEVAQDIEEARSAQVYQRARENCLSMRRYAENCLFALSMKKETERIWRMPFTGRLETLP